MLPFICPTCNKKLKNVYKSGNGSVLSCGNHNYPMIEGVLYLKDDRRSLVGSTLIKKGKIWKCKIILCDKPRRLSLPATLLLHPNFPIPFIAFVNIMRIFGYDQYWSRYLFQRKAKHSYKLSNIVAKTLKKGQATLDFGCGVGQLLPEIEKKVGPKNLFAIDSDYLNLIIARKFFTRPGTTLVCADGERGLPFLNHSLDTIIATDSFHYITKKAQFITESFRTLKKRGNIFLIQIINYNGRVFGNIRGITPQNLNRMLKRMFKNISIKSNAELVSSTQNSFNIKEGKNHKIKDKDEYSVFAQVQK